MKNKNLNHTKFWSLIEKYVLLILIILIFSSFEILHIIRNIRLDSVSIKRSENLISDNNKKLKERTISNKSNYNLQWMDYTLWVKQCASISNIYIYKNTRNLNFLSELPQNELDKISKTFNIEEEGKNYNNIVKFIIIDKSKKTFLTNDLKNIDFIKKNINKFSEENGELYNYISNKGKWYNLSYNSESTPANMINERPILENSNNFVECYWFPKNYIYSKKDTKLIENILNESTKITKDQINNEFSNISLFKDKIYSYKIKLAIYIILFISIILILYFLGKENLKIGLKNSLILKPFKFIKNWFENRCTLFKLITFIFFTYLVLNIIGKLLFYPLPPWGITLILFFIIIFYLIILLPKFIKFSLYLDTIIKGIEKITSGNLEYTIKEKGDNSLVKLANNINKLNKGFKVSIEDKIKNEKLKSELVTNVSHDLKTPLTSIINYTDILLRENISEEEKEEYLKILNRKSLKLKNLIEDLFEISKINSGKVELKKSLVDIVELINQSIGEYSDTEMYTEKNLKFIFKTYNPKIIMNLDGKKLSRVFENLINNAIKYSLENTRVYIEIENIEKGIKISFKNVSSTPLDFDKEEILERFTRGDKSRNSYIDGNGLGLAISKSIIELHDGIMYIDFDGDLFKSVIELNF